MPVTINLKNLESRIKNLSKLDMLSVGIKAQELNEAQIAKKKNSDNSPFKPYTPKYAARKGVSETAVDLVSNQKVRSKGGLSTGGHMMKEFGIVKHSKNEVIIGWTNPINKIKAAGNFVHRKFVGLTDQSRKKLLQYVFSLITKK